MASKTTNHILEAALHLASLGYRVFPVNRKKQPLAGSNGCKDATTDEQQIRKWFTRDMGWQLAVATGIDLFVLDLDCKNGHDGIASLHTLEAKYEELPYGPRVITPSGGQHWWFRYDPLLDLRCSVGVLGDGIDVRAEGGYVVVPTSVIESGAYRWAVDLDDCDPPPAPQWLIDLIQSPKANGGDGPTRHDTVQALIDAALSGQWHESVVRLVAHMVGKGLSDPVILLTAPALTLPGFTVEKTRSELQVMIKGARAKGWDVPEQPAPIYQANSIKWNEAEGTDPMNVQWLWPDRLVTSRINLIVGMGDVGKDVLACTLAAVVSTGRAWPDGRDLGRGPGTVGYVSSEDDPADTIVPRLIAAGADRKRVLLWKPFEPPKPADIADLDMLIVSPLIHILDGGDTNSDRDARAMIRPWQDAAERSGTSIIGICHYNKKNDLAAVQRVLGSVGLVNSVRCIWAIERDPDDNGRRLMLRLKGNLMKDDEATGLAFRIEHIGPWSQSIVCVWEKDDVRVTADEVHDKKRNGVKNKSASDWVVEFLESRGGMCEYGLIIDIGTKEGYTEASIKKAKERNHRILSVKIPPRNKPSDPWWWQLSKLEGSSLEDGIR